MKTYEAESKKYITKVIEKQFCKGCKQMCDVGYNSKTTVVYLHCITCGKEGKIKFVNKR
jgi:hypothetical protein